MRLQLSLELESALQQSSASTLELGLPGQAGLPWALGLQSQLESGLPSELETGSAWQSELGLESG